MTFAIKIFDTTHHLVASMMTATPVEILSFINKGFIVVDQSTGREFTIDEVSSMIGVSEAVIS